MKSLRTKFPPVTFAIAFAAILFASSAYAAPVPPKFEYKVVHFEIVTAGGSNLDEQRVAQLQAALNQLGSEGWELVVMAGGGLAILKRAL